jgi:hypothetical protein
MNNETKTKLLDLLIKRDFIILESNDLHSDNRYCNKKLINSFAKKKPFLLLNPLELIKSIKQVIRLMQFVKTLPNGLMTIMFNKNYHVRLVNAFLLDILSADKQVIFVKKKLTNATRKTSCVFLVDTKHDFRTYSKIFQEHTLLLCEINTMISKNDAGSYKIFNNLKDLQKFAFFIALIKSIFL